MIKRYYSINTLLNETRQMYESAYHLGVVSEDKLNIFNKNLELEWLDDLLMRYLLHEQSFIRETYEKVKLK